MKDEIKTLAAEVMDLIDEMQHTQTLGEAMYDNNRFFLFLPSHPVAGSLESYRSQGTAQLMSDGTFHFERKPRQRSQSVLIKKLPHGRVSETKDGAVQLTLKIYEDEDVDIVKTIGKEASEAKKAVKEWLMGK